MNEIPLRSPYKKAEFRGKRLIRRVLVNLHFSPVAKISDTSGDGMIAFQDAIRKEYPLYERVDQKGMRMEFAPGGEVREASEESLVVWQFYDAEKLYRVSLTKGSLAFESLGDGYSTWDNFFDRFKLLLAQVHAIYEPTLSSRIGVRFLNAAPTDTKDDPRKFCAPQLISVSGNKSLRLSDLFWLFEVAEGEMVLRSGLMPARLSYDPGFFEEQERETWYLDIDVISDVSEPFERDNIGKKLQAQALRLHAVYRWAMPVEVKQI